MKPEIEGTKFITKDKETMVIFNSTEYLVYYYSKNLAKIGFKDEPIKLKINSEWHDDFVEWLDLFEGYTHMDKYYVFNIGSKENPIFLKLRGGRPGNEDLYRLDLSISCINTNGQDSNLIITDNLILEKPKIPAHNFDLISSDGYTTIGIYPSKNIIAFIDNNAQSKHSTRQYAIAEESREAFRKWANDMSTDFYVYNITSLYMKANTCSFHITESGMVARLTCYGLIKNNQLSYYLDIEIGNGVTIGPIVPATTPDTVDLKYHFSNMTKEERKDKSCE